MWRLALLVCEAADEEDDDYTATPRASRSLILLHVDEAMAEGGWRVLDLEGKFELKRDDDFDPRSFL